MISNSDIFFLMETDTQEIFVEGIKKLLSDINKERKKQGKKKLTINKISESIGVTPDNLSGFLNYHRNYSESKRVDLAGFFGKKYLEVLDLGRTLLARDGDLSCVLPVPNVLMTSTNIPSSDPVVDIQEEADKHHQIVISGFENKEKAIKMNEMLVELEKLDPEGFRAAEIMLDGLLSAAREKKGLLPSQKQSQKNGTTGQAQK